LSSAQLPNKLDLEYWDNFVSKSSNFITARQIALVILFIALSVQAIGFMIRPSDILIWNALTFIVATNLGAVLLAIQAQNSADNIREMYKSAFDADFYQSLFLISQIKKSIVENAEKKGVSLKNEVESLGFNLYEFIEGYLEVFKEDKNSTIITNEKQEVIYESEEELFV
jgi:hypothetical protein